MDREITLEGGPYDGRMARIYRRSGELAWPDWCTLPVEGSRGGAVALYVRRTNRRWTFARLEDPRARQVAYLEERGGQIVDPTGVNDYDGLGELELAEATRGGVTVVTRRDVSSP